MRQPSQKEIEAVLALDGPARFRHFVKRVVDEERAWGLRHGGWALMATNDGHQVLPMYPRFEYAELCCIESWAAYKPEGIALCDLLGELLPELESRSIRPGVFPTGKSKGVVPSCRELADALKEEMARYE